MPEISESLHIATRDLFYLAADCCDCFMANNLRLEIGDLGVMSRRHIAEIRTEICLRIRAVSRTTFGLIFHNTYHSTNLARSHSRKPSTFTWSNDAFDAENLDYHL